MLYAIITIGIALCGAALFLHLKIPAGAYIGAVVFVGVFQLITSAAYLPPLVRTGCSIVAGSYIGTKVRRQDLQLLKKVPLAALLMLSALMLYMIVSALLLAKFTSIDLGNALLGEAPGGASEFSIAAMDMGYDSATVSLLQVLRLIIVVCVTPFAAKTVLRFRSPKCQQPPVRDPSPAADAPSNRGLRLLLTLAVGTVGGLFGKFSGLPAGTICWAMIGVATVNVFTGQMYFPLLLRRGASACSGALSGIRLSLAELLAVKDALPVILAIDLGWVALGVLVGLILHRCFKLPIETALFSAAPGGMTDMGLIAEDLGGNTAQVTVMQLCRTVSVLSICPWIVKFLVH